MSDRYATRMSSIGEIVEELRRELARLGDGAAEPAEAGAAGGEEDPPDPLELTLERMRATRAITSDHPPTTQPGTLAPARLATKRAISKAIRWKVERLALDTRTFAEATLDAQTAEVEAIHALADAEAALRAELAELQKEVGTLRERVAHVERRAAAPRARAVDPPATEAAPPIEQTGELFDYFAFEAIMRGSQADIAERQREYLPVLAELDDIVDVGCGRGELLVLLREAGKRARGVDADEDMVAQCRELGLEVELGDGVAYVAGLPEGSLGAVVACQLVEHLRPARLMALLEGARRALRPGGVLLVETINPASLSALRNYFADLTHAQPLVAETLAFLVESAGFRDVEIRQTSPLPDHARLAPVEWGPSVPEEAAGAANRNVELLNRLLFAPQDYAVIARA
jgi:SAM-dependent methyltransferase